MKILSMAALVALVLLALATAFLYKGDLPAAFVDQKYSNDASRFVETPDGARIHYRDQGSGPPIVLIHGSNASLHTFEPWVNELADDYRIVTLDLPGHGLTGRVPSGQYGSEAQTATVSAVVDHLGIDEFTLGGNSQGGGVTWRFALAYPERVQAMILIDAVPLPQFTRASTSDETAVDRSPPIAFQLLRQPWFRSIARYLDPRMLIEQGLESAYNGSPVVDEALIDRYYELTLREGTREAILERFGDSTGWSRDPVDPARLPQPTLVMWGAQDTLISTSIARQFDEALPDTHLVIYDDLGHVPNEEAPKRTAADVRAFLEQVYPERAAAPVDTP